MLGTRRRLALLALALLLVPVMWLPGATAYNVPKTIPEKSFFSDHYHNLIVGYGHTWITDRAAHYVYESKSTYYPAVGYLFTNVYEEHTAAEWIVAGAAFADSWGDRSVAEDSINHYYVPSTSDHQYGCATLGAAFGCSTKDAASYADQIWTRALYALHGEWREWCEWTGGDGSQLDVMDDAASPPTCDFEKENKKEYERVGIGRVQNWIGTSDPANGRCLYMVDSHTDYDARVEFPCNSEVHALFLLGWSVHLMEDATVPFHTVSDSECGIGGWCVIGTGSHEDYENYIEVAIRELTRDGRLPDLPLTSATLPLTTGCDENDPTRLVWPPKTAICGDVDLFSNVDLAGKYRASTWDRKTPGTWVRESAAMSHEFATPLLAMANTPLLYTGCRGTWNCWGAVVTFELDRAIKTSADAIYKFLEYGWHAGKLGGTPDDIRPIDHLPPLVTVSPAFLPLLFLGVPGENNHFIGSQMMLPGSAPKMEPGLPLTITIQDDRKLTSHSIALNGVTAVCRDEAQEGQCMLSKASDGKSADYFMGIRQSGNYLLTVKATDATGNEAVTEVLIRVDFDDPTATVNLDGPFDLRTGTFTGPVKVSVNATDVSRGSGFIQECWYALDGQATHHACNEVTEVGSGAHTVHWFAKDGAGRTNQSDEPFTVKASLVIGEGNGNGIGKDGRTLPCPNASSCSVSSTLTGNTSTNTSSNNGTAGTVTGGSGTPGLSFVATLAALGVALFVAARRRRT